MRLITCAVTVRRSSAPFVAGLVFFFAFEADLA
jgi:hypothetical protein